MRRYRLFFFRQLFDPWLRKKTPPSVVFVRFSVDYGTFRVGKRICGAEKPYFAEIWPKKLLPEKLFFQKCQKSAIFDIFFKIFQIDTFHSLDFTRIKFYNQKYVYWSHVCVFREISKNSVFSTHPFLGPF